MDWFVKVVILFFVVSAGLLLGGLLYFWALSKYVPILPKPADCALDIIRKQALLNKRIQKKNDKDLPDETPLRGLTLSKEDLESAQAEAKGQLHKLLQPEYAIAAGYFTQTTYDDLKSTWNSYSDTALGLIFALALLTFSLIVAPYIGSALACWIVGGLFLATALLFIIALGARDMFFAQVHNDLLAAIQIKYIASYQALDAAAKATIKAARDKKKAKAAEKDLQKAIQAEFKNATLSVKGLVVDLIKPEDDTA
jgi:hypothetical protein